MLTWFYRYLPVVIISIFLFGCEMTSISNKKEDNDNKVNYKIFGSKEKTVEINN